MAVDLAWNWKHMVSQPIRMELARAYYACGSFKNPQAQLR